MHNYYITWDYLELERRYTLYLRVALASKAINDTSCKESEGNWNQNKKPFV